METKFEVLANIFKDAEVAQKLLAYSPAEGCVVLKEQYNLDFTEEELLEVAEGIKAAINDASDELSADDLENVVGGGKSNAYYAGYYIGKTVIAGCVIVGGVAAVGAIISVGW